MFLDIKEKVSNPRFEPVTLPSTSAQLTTEPQEPFTLKTYLNNFIYHTFQFQNENDIQIKSSFTIRCSKLENL